MDRNLTVRDVKIGDRFYPKSKVGKATPIFEVRGPLEFSSGYGRLVRRCIDHSKGEFINKSASLEVIKTK